MTDVPAKIGRYRILSRIGRGGMGALFLGWDPELERQVAIKILIDDNDELRERFAREARSAARLHHPNIVTVYDVGEDAGRPFMAMEYIEGQTLADIIRKREPLTTARKIQLAEALVDGLAFAHKARIIHRDIKPANLMVDAGGTLKILDFGIARLAEATGMTRVGAALGTLNYMSPEQLSDHGIDHRSDIFSVGAVCYELLSYSQAFPGGLESGVLQRLLRGQTEPLATLCPSLDPEIVQIVHRCLDPDVQTRYQDLDPVRTDLARVRRRLNSQDRGVVVAVGQMSAPSEALPTPKPAPRRSIDPEALARRRSQHIEAHLKNASDAFAAGDYDTAIAESERVLMLDAQHGQAIEWVDRAKAAIEEQQAEQWLVEAEGDIERGALTAAIQKIEQATELSPSSQRVAQVREVADSALRERERARKRAAALQEMVERAHRKLDEGRFTEAVAAADEALALDPDQADARTVRARSIEAIEAQAREELVRRVHECIRDARRRFSGNDQAGALDLLARFEPHHELVSQALEELRVESQRIAEQRRIEAEQRAARERIETELVSARGEIERREFADAVDRLRALEAEGWSPEIAALIQTAQAGQVELEKAETLARDLGELVARASGLFARRDFSAALTRIDDALALDPGHGPARALRSKIQDGMRAAAETRDARERRARDREQSIAAALERGRRATSYELATIPLYEVLEIAPGHAEVQKLLEQWEDRIARDAAERRRIEEAERASSARIEPLVQSARDAVHRADVAEARRAIQRIRDVDLESLDAQWLSAELAAIHGEPAVSEAPAAVQPRNERGAPSLQPQTQVDTSRAQASGMRPADARLPSTHSASRFAGVLNVYVIFAVAALIVALLILGYFKF